MKDKQPKIEWHWRDGFPSFGSAAKIGDEIARMARSLGLPNNAINKHHIVDAAADAAEYPELNRAIYGIEDSDAATKWRLYQANQIIVSLGYRVVDDGEKTIRIGRVSVRTEDNERVYVPVPEAVRVEDYRRQMLADAARSIAAFQARYSELEKAAPSPAARAAFRMIRMGAEKLQKATEGGDNARAAAT